MVLSGTIGEAVTVLRRDGLVVYPTETIYGLGGDALSEDAVRKVYEVKRRLFSQPMSVAVSDRDMLHAIAKLDELADRFVEAFLPGPVTVVLPATSCLPRMLTGGGDTIGIRMPDHPIALRLIEELDAPITATSANIAGDRPPTRLDEIRIPCDCAIDGGALPGTPSTVVDLPGRRVLREGARAAEVAAFLREAGR
ncbi:MAG: L-threonylcarbamoyladenylate synthase [Methanomicrobiales archaeon]